MCVYFKTNEKKSAINKLLLLILIIILETAMLGTVLVYILNFLNNCLLLGIYFYNFFNNNFGIDWLSKS